jgi:hypothetical protein
MSVVPVRLVVLERETTDYVMRARGSALSRALPRPNSLRQKDPGGPIEFSRVPTIDFYYQRPG